MAITASSAALWRLRASLNDSWPLTTFKWNSAGYLGTMGGKGYPPVSSAEPLEPPKMTYDLWMMWYLPSNFVERDGMLDLFPQSAAGFVSKYMDGIGMHMMGLGNAITHV